MTATRIDGVMAAVDEIFAEEPMVEIYLDVIAVEHAEGHNKGLVKWKGNILCAKEGGETPKFAAGIGVVQIYNSGSKTIVTKEPWGANLPFQGTSFK